MQFFTEAVNVLKTLVIALGAGLAVWGVVNQLMAGGGVVLIGTTLVPLLSGLFS